MSAKMLSSEDVNLASKEDGGGGGEAVSVPVEDYKSVISSMAKASNSNMITAENYYLLHWLYRIRNASCARGLRIGFLQPDFLCIMYGSMLKSKKLRRNNDDIKEAANLWCSNRSEAEERYGHISDWDVSGVTDMSYLFRPTSEFNDDISRWDVSNVTNMCSMFGLAIAFNQAIGDWDVSKVSDMRSMFHGARAFNQSIGNWNVSNVNDMRGMFMASHSFNQPIGDWDVSNVTRMEFMFGYAHVFNQPLGNWDVSKVTRMAGMFSAVLCFNQDLTRWDMRSATEMEMPDMLSGAAAFAEENKPSPRRKSVNTLD